MRILFLFLIFCSYCYLGFSQKTIKLNSPDGRVQFHFSLEKGIAYYRVDFKNKPLVTPSRLELKFTGSGLLGNIRIGEKPVFREGIESYELKVGKAKYVSDAFREVVIPLQEGIAPFRKVRLIVRAFNEGVAFRYVFPEQTGLTNLQLAKELTEFRLTGNPQTLALLLPGYTTSHEGTYSTLPLSEIPKDTLVDTPALFQFPEKTYLAITEAALLDYAGMYLKKEDNRLVTSLSPWPDNPEIVVKSNLPHQSPWRVLLISDRLGDLFESNMITSLNDPSHIQDESWIKPGKTTFPWWNGSIIPDTIFAPGNNFENNKYYIDFCARHGIEYHSVVESNGHEWYTNDGEGYQPGPGADVTKPVPGIDMKQICDYAKSQGVDVRVWVHWKALYPKLDTAFALFEYWGLKGMMVDFMDRDDQEMTRIKEEILIKAARHKLHIQFHGVEKPTGLSRTYPNELTREGTLNYEVNKWEKRITPDHDLNIVFTRMLAGPTDYHMGGFRAIPDSLFKVQYTRPLMLGTRGHMLAMYVVLESYLGMVCDFPAAYEGQPGFEFIRMVPTVWDQTKVINASVGEYISIARRQGNEWYVGGITNKEARTLELDFSFLEKGEWEAEIYKDDPARPNEPNALIRETGMVDSGDKMNIQLNPGGGFAIRLKRKERV
ncbi:MAG: glycoside hydrolase family 97 protein [Chitinophagales bacterium]|nr:glycoside hydrolase family 97 protein [Chitinophagales bacterium]